VSACARQVASFKLLKTLDLSNNSIVALSAGSLALLELESLNLAGNKLKELPKVRRTRRYCVQPCPFLLAAARDCVPPPPPSALVVALATTSCVSL
jgi:Leucine-rich repeat (LRR) protein